MIGDLLIPVVAFVYLGMGLTPQNKNLKYRYVVVALEGLIILSLVFTLFRSGSDFTAFSAWMADKGFLINSSGLQRAVAAGLAFLAFFFLGKKINISEFALWRMVSIALALSNSMWAIFWSSGIALLVHLFIDREKSLFSRQTIFWFAALFVSASIVDWPDSNPIFLEITKWVEVFLVMMVLLGKNSPKQRGFLPAIVVLVWFEVFSRSLGTGISTEPFFIFVGLLYVIIFVFKTRRFFENAPLLLGFLVESLAITNHACLISLYFPILIWQFLVGTKTEKQVKNKVSINFMGIGIMVVLYFSSIWALFYHENNYSIRIVIFGVVELATMVTLFNIFKARINRLRSVPTREQMFLFCLWTVFGVFSLFTNHVYGGENNGAYRYLIFLAINAILIAAAYYWTVSINSRTLVNVDLNFRHRMFTASDKRLNLEEGISDFTLKLFEGLANAIAKARVWPQSARYFRSYQLIIFSLLIWMIFNARNS